MNAFLFASPAAASVLQQVGIWGVLLGFLAWAGLTLTGLRLYGCLTRRIENQALRKTCAAMRDGFRRLLDDVVLGDRSAGDAVRTIGRDLARCQLAQVLHGVQLKQDAAVTATRVVLRDEVAARVDRLLQLVAELSPICGLIATSAGYCEMLRTASNLDNPSFTDLAGPASLAPLATMMGLGVALICVLAMTLLRPDIERERQRKEVERLHLDLMQLDAELKPAVRRVRVEVPSCERP